MGILVRRLLLFCLWLTTGGGVLAAEREHTLILGLVSDNPKREAAAIRPMVDYAASRMAAVGITAGALFIARDKDDLVDALRRGAVDWVTDTPFPILYFIDRTEAEIIAHRWKSGVAEYHTVFVARRDSGITRLADLRGQKIVFQDPDSSTAYFVPKALLKQHGLPLVELSSPRLHPPPERVGYVFGREETFNQLAWLQRRLVAAAAMSNLDWQAIPAEAKAELVVFYASPSFPRGLELVRKTLDPRLKQRLREVLYQAHQDPNAAVALTAYNKTLRFDPLTAPLLEGMAAARRIMQAYALDEPPTDAAPPPPVRR